MSLTEDSASPPGDPSGGSGRGAAIWSFATSYVIPAFVVLGLIAFGYDQWATYHRRPDVIVASYPTQIGSTARADAITYYRQVMSAMQRCQDAGISQFAATDSLSKYETARDIESKCNVERELRGLPIPRSVGRTVAFAFAKARIDCALTSGYWSISAAYLKDGVKDGEKVEDLAQARDFAIAATKWYANCATSFVGPPRALGVTSAELGI